MTIGNPERVPGTSSLDISGHEGFAGGDIVLKVSIVSDPPCDLSGHAVEIFDENDALLGRAEIVEMGDDFVNQTEEFVANAPADACDLQWRAVLGAYEADGTVYPETSCPFIVTVKPHPVYMTVWDVPYSVNAGERATIKVGVKCGAGCSLGGTMVLISDEDGKEIVRARVGETPWKKTESLYAAEIEIMAPDNPGEYKWHAAVPPPKDGPTHEETQYRFTLRVVPPPEVTVTIEAVSQETGNPIPDARVVMHPYRSRTDVNGIARIRAAKGEYTIMISKSRFDPMSQQISLNADWQSRVQLTDEEPEFNPDDNY